MKVGAEILFPPYAVAYLKDLRGPQWRQLVERVLRLEEDHPEALAFSWMMIRLDGCRTCEVDSFKAMQGCAACAVQTIRRFKGSDAELLKLYDEALSEVRAYLSERRKAARRVKPIARTAAGAPLVRG